MRRRWGGPRREDMTYTDEQVTSANRLYKKVFEYGTDGAVALQLIVDFVASRDSRVRADAMAEAADSVQCVTSQLPGFSGGCARNGVDPCSSCISSARLRGAAAAERSRFPEGGVR